MENRQCIKCGEVKDICMFGKKTPTRISTICKKCHNKGISERRKERAKVDEEYRKKINRKRVIRIIKKYKSDPIFNFKKKLRKRIGEAFKNKGFSKTSKTREILGAEWKVIKEYFEKRFQEGMTWENHGEWHIDHILPISTATSPEDVIRLNHYTNLQPLWAEDNIKKSDTLTPLGILKEHLPYSEVLEIKK
jgi:hypothetical protein